ncbi:glucosidase family protein [Terriglobus tenax]|uniref:hypothetical protein n=1 Tax=Terriglobus tenax TaxID=1111115 RepID=UPI0021E0996E|nr:hypothetical protein [Terriglobus tenax]
MRIFAFTVCAIFASAIAAQQPVAPGKVVVPLRMVSPSIDEPGKPFSYASRSTDQISVMHATAGTEITPEGYLYSGYGELMFFLGIDRQPLSSRIRTLEEGYLPIVHYSQQHDGVEYHFTAFAASLGKEQDGTHVANFVRVTVSNPSSTSKRAFLTTAWRYQAEQTTPYQSGDNRFERPVEGKQPGDPQQQGAPFRADASYRTADDAYLQDGKAIYLFPADSSPLLRPYFREFYNLLDLGPVGIATTLTPSTPVATAQFTVNLKPGETRDLDFKMPLAPLAENSDELAILRASSFNERKQQVADFWKKLLDRGLVIETPERKVNDTFRTSLVNDLLSLNKVGNQYVQTINQLHYHGFYLRDSADFVRMYDTSSYPEIGRQVLDFFATKQRENGNFLSQEGQYDGWGEALWTYGEHYRMTHDKAFAAEVYPRILHAVQWLEGALQKEPLHIMPSTDVRDNEFVPGHLTGYNFLALNGLQSAQMFARELGHPDDEKRFHQLELNLRTAFMVQLRKASEAAGGKIPPSLDPGAGGTDWGNLLSVTPEEQLNPLDPMVTATLKDTQSRYQEGIMTYHQDGQGEYLHHYLTIKNTLTELVRGEDQQAISELYAVLLHTSSTNAGFEYSIRPWGDRDFSGNLAPHGWFAAEYRNLLRNMMVRERGNELHLLSAVSPEWIGEDKSIRVERAATYFGSVSFTLTGTGASSARLIYTVDATQKNRLKQVVAHLPWFLDGVTATVDDRPVTVTNRQLILPIGSHTVELRWQKRSIDATMSYEKIVDAYKQEYRRRYEEQTGYDGR